MSRLRTWTTQILEPDAVYDIIIDGPNDQPLEYERVKYLGQSSALWPNAPGGVEAIDIYVFWWTDESGDRQIVTALPSRLIKTQPSVADD